MPHIEKMEHLWSRFCTELGTRAPACAPDANPYAPAGGVVHVDRKDSADGPAHVVRMFGIPTDAARLDRLGNIPWSNVMYIGHISRRPQSVFAVQAPTPETAARAARSLLETKEAAQDIHVWRPLTPLMPFSLNV